MGDSLTDPLSDERPCPTDLKCAICCYTYNEPVMLSCGHSFCGNCASEWLRSNITCPTCRAGSNGNPIRNIALGQIVSEHNRIMSEMPVDVPGEGDSSISPPPGESLVRTLEVPFSRRIRKGSAKIGDATKRLRPFDNSTTPLSVAAAGMRLERPDGYVYTGLTPDRSFPLPSSTPTSPSPRPFVRGGARRSVAWDDRRQEISPRPNRSMEYVMSPEEMKRSSILRRSLGRIRKSVRILKGKDKKDDSIDESKEEEDENEKSPKKEEHGEHSGFSRSKSTRKSLIRRLLGGWKGKKEETKKEVDEITNTPVIDTVFTILVLDSTANLTLIQFIRSIPSSSSFRVLSPMERRDLSPSLSEFEGLVLVSILMQSDSSNLSLFDIYECRREMSGDVELCSPLVHHSSAVLLFCATDPSSALQATSDFRYVQRERNGLTEIPTWTVLATMQESGPVRKRSGQPFSLAQANRLSASELSTRLLPTRQISLDVTLPPGEQFTQSFTQLLCQLNKLAVPLKQ